jgi:thiol-disulfide isomerase/thioredoxin
VIAFAASGPPNRTPGAGVPCVRLAASSRHPCATLPARGVRVGTLRENLGRIVLVSTVVVGVGLPLSPSAALAQGAGGVTPTTHIDTNLPAFELRDLDGNAWTNASLAGKTVFINVWATWCKPCNAELPYVQKLYELVRNRTDVMLVTVNVDEQPAKAAPFVKAKGYTFPVLYGFPLIRETMRLKGIPRNWVLDAAGVIRVDEFGYEGRTDWVEWAVESIRSVQKKH